MPYLGAIFLAPQCCFSVIALLCYICQNENIFGSFILFAKERHIDSSEPIPLEGSRLFLTGVATYSCMYFPFCHRTSTAPSSGGYWNTTVFGNHTWQWRKKMYDEPWVWARLFLYNVLHNVLYHLEAASHKEHWTGLLKVSLNLGETLGEMSWMIGSCLEGI